MKYPRSLKLFLFCNVLLAALLVLYANRSISYFSLELIIEKEQVHQLSRTLQNCIRNINDEVALKSCIRTWNQGLVDNFTAGSYVLCSSGFSAAAGAHDSLCMEPFKDDAVQSAPGDIRSGSLIHAGKAWRAALLESGPDRLLIAFPLSRTSEAVAGMWSARDQLLLYSAIPLFISLIFLALFVSHQSTRMINNVGRSLEKLHPDRLDQRIDVVSPFKEFDDFVNLYKRQHEIIQDHTRKSRRFVSQASHELRTPLTILSGNTELLMNELETGSSQQQRLASMKDEIEELIEIMNKLLLLQRADDRSLLPGKQSLNFSHFISNYLEGIENFSTSVTFEIYIAPDLYFVCEPQLIKQLIANLVSNSIKYNIPNGWVSVDLTSQDEGILLRVTNPTSGLNEELTDQVFERFYRGPNSKLLNVDGHGLGLSICREIARAHGAELTMSFVQGVVAFTCRFPLVKH